MAEALTRKQIIQAVWNKFKAIIGNHDISGMGDGTVTGALAGLNGNITDTNKKVSTLRKIGFASRVINPNNASPAAQIYISELFPGETNVTNRNTFVYAYNSDEGANARQVDKVTVRGNGQVLLYFSENFSGNMRVNFIGFLFD